MAAMQLYGSPSVAMKSLPSFEGLRRSPSMLRIPTSLGASGVGLDRRCFRSLVVKAATVVAPKYTSVKPLGDRVLVKIKTAEEKTVGGILLPTTAQSKPQGGEVVAVGEGKSIGNKKIDPSVQSGAQIVYSKYAGTELEFDGSNHLILKEDDIVGILETEDVKDLKPLNDRVLIKVIAVGPGPLDEEGNRKPLTVTPGNTVLYSKYAGNEFKGADGSDYIALRATDVMAVLS
ncbi:hypothetical protein QJS10_CPB19g01943 [Acorus calamus]|uniref:Uncharacterized protein n=1 Tax=Acorus calamus TaxID=4465 RepID=A0AAV9CJF7_ACOCL|nr:hypothetical protein QJS10_CPB19g01943 [Acorus calamus]